MGVDIVTIGQYLRPTSHHLPVARWVEPAEFDRWAELGESLGIGHVEASPLTRSSYHAKEASADAAAVVPRSRIGSCTLTDTGDGAPAARRPQPLHDRLRCTAM